jgi:hypothetical protein
MRVEFYWRDVWIGVYIAEDRVYVCPLPCLVFSWARREGVREAKEGPDDYGIEYCPECRGFVSMPIAIDESTSHIAWCGCGARAKGE